MEQMIIKICITFLSISNICMLYVMIKITDRVTLHSKLISEILNNLCDALGKEEEEEG